ncbi:MAG: protein-export rane protein SecD/SecF family [Burkholderiales bacterium]|nr:protein-export rane protein SecD/SecF family [Burkholderiales bacterium]
MEFFKIRRTIPFMRYAVIFNVISVLTFVAAVASLALQGLNFSIEFTGGTLIEVSYPQASDVQQIRTTLEKAGYKAEVQNFGSSRDVLIRMPIEKNQSTSQLSQEVQKLLRTADAGAEVRRIEFVGPQVGRELAEYGALALLVTSVVLAILGYSVNESVVIFDRVRENFRKMRKADTTEILDAAITANISRTIITHGSTQIMALTMLLFGGPALHYFAVALTIGILFGIYSSVFVAAALLMWFKVSRAHFIKPPPKRDEHEGAVV